MKMPILDYVLGEELLDYGFALTEDDHVTYLWCEEHLVATFSAAKVTAEDVKRVANEYLELRGQKYDERRIDK